MGVAVAEKPKGKKKDEHRERLLRLLTYEVVDGKPIYYRGYKEVLEGRKQPEEVMGSSTLQWYLLRGLVKHLFQLEDKGYVLAFGEVGLHISKGKNRSLDIALFRVSAVKPDTRYSSSPPVLVIEIDVKADVGDVLEYMLNKVEELLNFGTDKVVWIFTKPRKVFVFEKGKRPTIYDWDEEVELLEGVKVRLSDLLKQPKWRLIWV